VPVAGRRIAVLRALPGVGDLLCAVPALRAIRMGHPAATIVLVGLPSASWFVQRYPDLVDGLLPVAGVAGLPEVEPDAARALRFLRRAQAEHFDLAVQIHGSGEVTNPLMTLLGARHHASSHRPGQWVPPGASIEYPGRGHEIDRLLAVVAAAGCPPVGAGVDLRVTADEHRTAARLVERAGLVDHQLACIHPGASRPDRRWPAERFAEVGDHLADRGLSVVATGTWRDRPVVRAVADRMRSRLLDLSGYTGIGVLGAFYERARLVVTNDTGASHVAAAVGAPSVVVIGSAEPDRWAPLDGQRHRAVSGAPPGAWPGAGAVITAVDDQLGRRPPARGRLDRARAGPAHAAAGTRPNGESP
jgi:ADP-heptose:LPS heptosyltransferase